MALTEFARAREMVQFSIDAFREVEAELNAFARGVSAVSFTEIEAATGCILLKTRLSKQLPKELNRKTADGVLHARHSFDASLFAACSAIGKPPKKDVHYPWSTTPEDLEQKLAGPNGRIPSEFWDTIREQIPYTTADEDDRGNNLVREMSKIANRKHTIGIAVNGYVAGGTVTPGYMEKVDLLEIPMPKWNPETNDMLIARYKPNLRLENSYEFRFNVIFERTNDVRPIPVILGLGAFAGQARHVLQKLEARVEELRQP